MPALGWLLNLDFAGSAAALVVAAEPDGRRSDGAGRKKREPPPPAWWEGEWINPDEVYRLPKAPPPDVIPLRPKVVEARARIDALKADVGVAELRDLRRSATALSNRVATLEKRARTVTQARQVDAVVASYRKAAATERALVRKLDTLEVDTARRKRILAEDEKFLQLIMDIL